MTLNEAGPGPGPRRPSTIAGWLAGWSLQGSLALLLACLFFVTGFAGLEHHAQQAHTRCAEHGELIHASELGPEDGPREGDEHGEHEHCEIGPLADSSIASHPLIAAVGVADLPSVAPFAGADAAARPQLVLDHRRAPKTSPPSRS